MIHHAALVSPHCYYSLFICYKINAPFQVQNKQQQQQQNPISGVISKDLCWSQIRFSSPLLLVYRLRLHEAKVIKDRRHHLRTYPNCFVAKELIDWLIEHKEASDRDTAIKIVQKLLDQSIIHHGRALFLWESVCVWEWIFHFL